MGAASFPSWSFYGAAETVETALLAIFPCRQIVFHWRVPSSCCDVWMTKRKCHGISWIGGWILRANSGKNLTVTWNFCCVLTCDSSHGFPAGDSGFLGHKLGSCRRNGGCQGRLCQQDEGKNEVRVAGMDEICSKVEIVNEN